MEFKGTRGNWIIVKDELFSINSVVCNGIVICDLKLNKYNDLLISKAPEMLDMLQRIIKTYDKGTQTYLDCKQLIKQATEL